MRKYFSVLFVLVFVIVAVLPAAAQDMMDEKIVCDSTVITLLLVAEYEFGYEPMMDVSVFEKGQFQPLFDAMMSMMEEGDMMDDMTMDDNAMMDDMMMDDMMVVLEPGAVADEPAECADLRASVESFLYDHFSQAMMMGDGM